MKGEKEVGILGHLPAGPDVPPGGIANRSKPQPIDGKHPFPYIARDSNLNLWAYAQRFYTETGADGGVLCHYSNPSRLFILLLKADNTPLPG